MDHADEHDREHHHHDVHVHANGSMESTVAVVEQRGPTTSTGEVIYTCPMHPQVRQVGPGNCPICGMALEPVAPTTAETENPELVDMTRRFWVAVAFTLPLLMLAMGRVVGIDAAGAVDRIASSLGLPHLDPDQRQIEPHAGSRSGLWLHLRPGWRRQVHLD